MAHLSCEGLELMKPRSVACLNILHGNSDKVTNGLEHFVPGKSVYGGK